jgi:outer membrane protein assembly factor BamB
VRDRRGHRRLVIAGAVGAAVVVVGAAVSALSGGRGATAELLDTDERIALPAAVDREPHVAWRRPVEAASVIGVGGVVVAAERDGVSAYSARTGVRRWRLPAGPDGQPGISRLGTDRVLLSYGPADHGEGGLRVVVVDAEDGRVRWRYRGQRAEFASGIGEDHVAVLSTFRIGQRDIGVTILSADRGTTEWTADGFPLAVGERTVFMVDDERLVAVDLETGRRRWSRDVSSYDRNENRGAAAVEGTVVLARSDTAVVGLSAADGSFLWSHALAEPAFALRPAGGLVVAIGRSEAVGIDPATGREIWQVGSDAWREYPYVRVESRNGIYALGQAVTRSTATTPTSRRSPTEPSTSRAPGSRSRRSMPTRWRSAGASPSARASQRSPRPTTRWWCPRPTRSSPTGSCP